MTEIKNVGRFESGKVVAKTKKIFPVTSMTDADGASTLDHTQWGELVGGYFADLWKCEDPTLRARVDQWLAENHSSGIQILQDEIEASLCKIKRQRHLDHLGCCASAVFALDRDFQYTAFSKSI